MEKPKKVPKTYIQHFNTTRMLGQQPVTFESKVSLLLTFQLQPQRSLNPLSPLINCGIWTQVSLGGRLYLETVLLDQWILSNNKKSNGFDRKDQKSHHKWYRSPMFDTDLDQQRICFRSLLQKSAIYWLNRNIRGKKLSPVFSKRHQTQKLLSPWLPTQEHLENLGLSVIYWNPT